MNEKLNGGSKATHVEEKIDEKKKDKYSFEKVQSSKDEGKKLDKKGKGGKKEASGKEGV